MLCLECASVALGLAVRTLRLYLIKRVFAYHKMRGSIRIPADEIAGYKRKTLVPKAQPTLAVA